MAIILTAYPNSLEVTQGEHIVEGGIYVNDVEFCFPGDAWDGMALVAVFETALDTKGQVLGVERTCKIPWEVIDWGSAGSYLKIGLYGAKEEDLTIIVRPTVWTAMPFRILPGVDATPTQEPTPTQYQQMLAQTGKVLVSAEAVLQSEHKVQALTNKADEHERQAGIYARQANDAAREAKTVEQNVSANTDVAKQAADAAAAAKQGAEASANTAQAARDEVVGKLPELTQRVDQHDKTLDNLDGRTDTLEQKVADLLYKVITIDSFSHDAGTQEMGAIVTDVVLRWATNKVPAALTLDGAAIDANLTSKTLSGLHITKDSGKSWVLKATDERAAVATKSTSISFLNGVYYGVGAEPESVDSAFLLGLTRVLTGSRGRSITVNAGGGEYIWYCLPVRLGACTFKVGGFEGGFGLVATVDFTNASGYTEPYRIYRSDNADLGSTKVEVS